MRGIRKNRISQFYKATKCIKMTAKSDFPAVEAEEVSDTEKLTQLNQKRSELLQEVKTLKLMIARGNGRAEEKELQLRHLAVKESASTLSFKPEAWENLASGQTKDDKLAENNPPAAQTGPRADSPFYPSPSDPPNPPSAALGVHTVKIRYVKHLKDGEVERLRKSSS